MWIWKGVTLSHLRRKNIKKNTHFEFDRLELLLEFEKGVSRCVILSIQWLPLWSFLKLNSKSDGKFRLSNQKQNNCWLFGNRDWKAEFGIKTLYFLDFNTCSSTSFNDLFLYQVFFFYLTKNSFSSILLVWKIFFV